jgi:hypothetical protein
MMAAKSAESGYHTPDNNVAPLLSHQHHHQHRAPAPLPQQCSAEQSEQRRLQDHLRAMLEGTPSAPLRSLDEIADSFDAQASTSSVDAPLIVQAYHSGGREAEAENLEWLRPKSAGTTAPPRAIIAKRSRLAAHPSTASARHEELRHNLTHWSTGHWVRGPTRGPTRGPHPPSNTSPAACSVPSNLSAEWAPRLVCTQRLALDEGCWPRRPEPAPLQRAFRNGSDHHASFTQPTGSARRPAGATPASHQPRHHHHRGRGQRKHSRRSSKVMNPVAIMGQKAMFVNPAASFRASPPPCSA